MVFIWIISINKWKQNNKWSQIHSLGSIVNSERSVLNTLFLSNSHQVTQYWHLQATTLHIFPLFTVNILAIMTIITHYQWIGSRDGGTQGVWSNAPQGISLVCVCVCVFVGVYAVLHRNEKVGTSSVPILIFLLTCLIEVVGVYIIEGGSLNHSPSRLFSNIKKRKSHTSSFSPSFSHFFSRKKVLMERPVAM